MRCFAFGVITISVATQYATYRIINIVHKLGKKSKRDLEENKKRGKTKEEKKKKVTSLHLSIKAVTLGAASFAFFLFQAYVHPLILHSASPLSSLLSSLSLSLSLAIPDETTPAV